jgi:hypothetical protein
MAMEHGGESESYSGYPKDIRTKDGTIRRVQSRDEEIRLHEEEREQD